MSRISIGEIYDAISELSQAIIDPSGKRLVAQLREERRPVYHLTLEDQGNIVRATRGMPLLGADLEEVLYLAGYQLVENIQVVGTYVLEERLNLDLEGSRITTMPRMVPEPSNETLEYTASTQTRELPRGPPETGKMHAVGYDTDVLSTGLNGE